MIEILYQYIQRNKERAYTFRVEGGGVLEKQEFGTVPYEFNDIILFVDGNVE